MQMRQDVECKSDQLAHVRCGHIEVLVARELQRHAELKAGLHSAVMAYRNEIQANPDAMLDTDMDPIPASNTIPQTCDNDQEDDFMCVEQWNDAEQDSVRHDDGLAMNSGGSTSRIHTAYNTLLQRMWVRGGDRSDADDVLSDTSNIASESGSDGGVLAEDDINVSEIEDMLAKNYYDDIAGTGLQLEDELDEDIERQSACALEGKL